MSSIRWHEALAPLASAIAPGLSPGLAAMGAPASPTGGLAVSVGATGLRWGALTVDESLLGPSLYGEEDAALAELAPGFALDRFRRLTGLVLEAVLLHRAIEADEGGPQGGDPSQEARQSERLQDPWRRAAAALAVDAALPALGWLLPALAGLALEPEQSALDAPRRLAWYLRWAGGPTPPTPASWVAFGAWIRDRKQGPLAQVSAPLSPAPARPLPGGEWLAAALSHRPVQVEGGERGCQLIVRGVGRIAGPESAPPRGQANLLLGAVSAGYCLLRREAAGPIGGWTLDTGSYGHHVGGARGVELHLHEDGRVEIVGADAFVGRPTPELLEMAESVGLSGTAAGRWTLTELEPDGRSGALHLTGLELGPVSLHPRKGRRFLLPADAMVAPVRATLAALQAGPIRWRTFEADGQLRLSTHRSLGEGALAFHFSLRPPSSGLES